MPIIGLDIGGANLKASDGQSQSILRPFAIWKEPQRLAEELRLLLAEFLGVRGQESGVGCQESEGDAPRNDLSLGISDLSFGDCGNKSVGQLPMTNPQSQILNPSLTLAVTMTAELADCFATKSDGVNFILDAVGHIADESAVRVWQTGGEFVSTDEARELTSLVAAANWHALATWVARLTAVNETALLIDLGSTTCDIIPLVGGLPMSTGRTDIERLLSGELVYTGVRRTPLVAVCHSVPFRDGWAPLAAEFFATTLDVSLLLGEIAEDSSDTNTANGKPATIDAAWDRMARSICCDRSECSLNESRIAARYIRSQQHRQIASAIQRVVAAMPQPPSQIVLSGEGEPMLRGLIESIRQAGEASTAILLSLREMLGPAHSSCACAYALTRLATERGLG